jgi:sec-independent protein translocase protein TatC
MALVPFPSQANKPAPDDLDPDWDDQDQEESDAGKMSFLDHLDELRRRLIYSLISIAAGFLIAFSFINRIYDFVMLPLAATVPNGKLVYTEPMEAFSLYIWMAVIAGILIAAPLVLTQVWLFIAPGLYQHEKKLAIPFVALTTICFVSGAAFSHYVAFPAMFAFGASFGSEKLEFLPRIEPIFDMYLRMLLAFGLIFQMPPIVFFMARMGMVTGRFLMRYFKYAVLVIFIAAAVLTPSGDPYNQTLMAAPMILLYLFSALLAAAFGKKRTPAVDVPDESGE